MACNPILFNRSVPILINNVFEDVLAVAPCREAITISEHSMVGVHKPKRFILVDSIQYVHGLSSDESIISININHNGSLPAILPNDWIFVGEGSHSSIVVDEGGSAMEMFEGGFDVLSDVEGRVIGWAIIGDNETKISVVLQINRLKKWFIFLIFK